MCHIRCCLGSLVPVTAICVVPPAVVVFEHVGPDQNVEVGLVPVLCVTLLHHALPGRGKACHVFAVSHQHHTCGFRHTSVHPCTSPPHWLRGHVTAVAVCVLPHRDPAVNANTKTTADYCCIAFRTQGILDDTLALAGTGEINQPHCTARRCVEEIVR